MPSTFRGEQTLNAQVGNYITDTPNCPKIGGSGWNMYFKSGANIKHFIRACTPFFSKIKYMYCNVVGDTSGLPI